VRLVVSRLKVCLRFEFRGEKKAAEKYDLAWGGVGCGERLTSLCIRHYRFYVGWLRSS